MIKNSVLLLVLYIVLLSCGSENKKDDEALKTEDWETISKSTAGKTVNFMMWQGSPVINDYINNYVIPTVKEKYDIDLQISGGQAGDCAIGNGRTAGRYNRRPSRYGLDQWGDLFPIEKD